MTNLNIGCGFHKLDGFINIDKSNKSVADKIIDLELPNCLNEFKDNSVEKISARNILEHIQNIIPLMNECYRVLKKNGSIFIVVPQGDGIWADPTHVRGFSKISFRYYCGYPLAETYGITAKFSNSVINFEPNEDGGSITAILTK